MRKIESSDFHRGNFNNVSEGVVECSSFSAEYQDANYILNDGTRHAEIPSVNFTEELLVRLQNVTQVPKSSVGLLFTSVQMLNDWHKLGEFGLHLDDWITHLSQVIQNLKQDSDFETDRLQAKTIKNPVLKVLLLNPSSEYNPIQKDWVFAIRGLVLIRAIVANKKPSSQLIAGLTKFFAKNPAYENIANLNLTAIKEYIPNSNQQNHDVFLSTLQTLVTKTWVELESLVSPKHAHLKQAISTYEDDKSVKEESLTLSNIVIDQDEQQYKLDLINYITYVQQFMGEKQNVGINERYEYVQSFEIEIIIPEIVEDLKNPDLSKVAVATLLTFLLHCRPERFRLIALESTPKATAWLDIHGGCFCWSLNALIERNSKDAENNISVCIPLPNEIVTLLRGLYLDNQKKTNNLGELFDFDMTELDAKCKQYLRNKGLSSHRPTLSRLEASYSRYVLAHTRDGVYAVAIGLDFCIDTTSNFNYCVLRGSRLIQVLQNVYGKLGFSKQLLAVPEDVGSKTGLAYDQVWRLVKSLSIQVHEVISHLPRNLTFQNIVETHNHLAQTVGSLLVIFTGHRAAESYTFSAHTIDLKRGLCILCDKRVTDYQQVRLVPIPLLIIQWLDLYFSWLESLKYRLLSINRQLALQVEAAINSASAQSHPLFFTIINSKIASFSSRDFSKVTNDLNLPTNCGRHFLDYVLRDGGLGSAHIMALEGHANLGQEAFGPISLMSMNKIANETRDVINQAIEVRKIITPPKFNPRSYVCKKNLRMPRIQFKNLLKDKYEIKDKRSAQCPFEEKSLEFLNALIKHNQSWKEVTGEVALKDLVYSLTLIDGVASFDELLEVISRILESEIYALNNCFFVDTVTKKLGVRRVWVSFATVLIAGSLAESGNQLNLDLNNVAFKLLCESLVDSVSAHYSVYGSGMMAAWARGEVCSRISRPETLARHHFNYPEKSNFGFTESNRREILLDDSLIRKAINRASDTNQNLGTNETRLKQLSAEIDQLLSFQIDEISTLILAKFTQYLISFQMAPTSISRYYTVIRQFLDYFLEEVSELSQLAQINWGDIVQNWQQVERLDADSGPETAAINHFLTFVDSNIKIKGSLHDLNSAVMEYADFPSLNEISKAFNYIDNDPALDEATRLKVKVMMGLLAQYALRPSEVRNIRLCDVYAADPVHFVITSEAVGKVKTKNANRVLLLIDDQFSTKQNLLQLFDFKTGLPDKAFLFGDDVDGSTLDGSQLLFNVARYALSLVTGHDVSIMSFRHFNVTRDVNCAIDNAGTDALNDRKVLSVIAANSGHGHARTSLQNYCCDLDKQRHKFWEQHRSQLKMISPISEIKKRMGLEFKGNLPDNKPSFLLLMQLLSNQFPKTHARIKNCQDFVCKKDLVAALEVEPNGKHLTAPYKYCFFKFSGADSDLAIFGSSILELEKLIFDEGASYLTDTLNKDWHDQKLIRFRPIIQSATFLKILQKIGLMAINERDAIQIAQAINYLHGKWDIKNLKLLDLLERNLPIFLAAGIGLEMSINQNLQVNIRKSLRQKPFIQLSEKVMPRDVLCQVSFWDSGMKNSMRAKHHQEIMIQVSLIFLTKAILVLGKRNA